jgi:hypothetical protein
MAITNPDANTIRLTDESSADFDDIVSAGVSGITKTGTATYVITRALSLVNSTLSDTSKIIRFEWGAITTPLLIDDDSELQLGELNGDGYGINGCQVFMNSSYSGSSTINLGGPESVKITTTSRPYSIRQHRVRLPVVAFTSRTLQERRFTTRHWTEADRLVS